MRQQMGQEGANSGLAGAFGGQSNKPITLYVLPKYANDSDRSVAKNEEYANGWQQHLKSNHNFDVTTRVISKVQYPICMSRMDDALLFEDLT